MYWFWTHFFYLCISILNIFDFFFAPSSIFNFIFLLLLLLVILFYYYFIFHIFLYFIIIILLFFLSPHFLPQNPKFPPPPFPFSSSLPSFFFFPPFFFFQFWDRWSVCADDVTTIESSKLLIIDSIRFLIFCFSILLQLFKMGFSVARAKGCVPPSRVGCAQQTTIELFL